VIQRPRPENTEFVNNKRVKPSIPEIGELVVDHDSLQILMVKSYSLNPSNYPACMCVVDTLTMRSSIRYFNECTNIKDVNQEIFSLKLREKMCSSLKK
jgi:hypothetical protein